MGIFSSRIRTYVDTSIQRVIADKDIKLPYRQSVMEAILQNTSLVDAMDTANQSALAQKMSKMLRYAKKHYPIGLPKGHLHTNRIDKTALLAYLRQREGKDISLSYAFVSSINYTHVIWQYLHEQKAYNSQQNTFAHDLSAGLLDPEDQAIYLHDAEIRIAVPKDTEPDPYFRMPTWGESPKKGKTRARESGVSSILITADFPIYLLKIIQEGDSLTDTATIYFEYQGKENNFYFSQASGYNNDPLIQRQEGEYKTRLGSFDVPLGQYDNDASYLQCKYVADGINRYLTYKVGNEVQELNNLIHSQTVESDYFPRIYFRFMKKAVDNNKTDQVYKSSKRMCKYLGFDYDEVLEAVNKNPDITDVHQAMIAFMVPANSSDQKELRYLFDYFKNLFNRQVEADSSLQQERTSGLDPDVLRNVFDISEGTRKETAGYGFEMRDEWTLIKINYIDIINRKLPGDVCPVGQYVMTLEEDRPEETNTSMASNDGIQWSRLKAVNAAKVHKYRKQLYPGIYEEVAVYGLEIGYQIEGNWIKQGKGDDKILLVPLDKSIVHTYPKKIRDEVYAKSIHFVFNSLVQQKVRWYERGWFRRLLQVVGIVLTIVSLGTSAILGSLMSAINAGLSAVASLLFKFVLSLAVVKITILAAVEVFGEKFAALLALAVAAYAFIFPNTNFSIARLGNITANDLLQAANSLINQATASIGGKIQELVEGFDALRQEMLAMQTELDRANALLENRNRLSPAVIMGESPDDFFYRTSHAGNVGITVFTHVSHFHEMALSLPTFQQTYRGF